MQHDWKPIDLPEPGHRRALVCRRALRSGRRLDSKSHPMRCSPFFSYCDNSRWFLALRLVMHTEAHTHMQLCNGAVRTNTLCPLRCKPQSTNCAASTASPVVIHRECLKTSRGLLHMNLSTAARLYTCFDRKTLAARNQKEVENVTRPAKVSMFSGFFGTRLLGAPATHVLAFKETWPTTNCTVLGRLTFENLQLFLLLSSGPRVFEPSRCLRAIRTLQSPDARWERP